LKPFKTDHYPGSCYSAALEVKAGGLPIHMEAIEMVETRSPTIPYLIWHHSPKWFAPFHFV